jgi:hypothetical protein
MFFGESRQFGLGFLEIWKVQLHQRKTHVSPDALAVAVRLCFQDVSASKRNCDVIVAVSSTFFFTKKHVLDRSSQ